MDKNKWYKYLKVTKKLWKNVEKYEKQSKIFVTNYEKLFKTW